LFDKNTAFIAPNWNSIQDVKRQTMSGGIVWIREKEAFPNPIKYISYMYHHIPSLFFIGTTA